MNKKKTISVSLDEKLLNKIENYMETEGRSRSSAINYILHLFFEEDRMIFREDDN